jgi:hypothetical protein
MILVKRIYKQSLFILLPICIIAAFIEWKKLPVSIFIGGTLGLANLRGLAKGVHGLITTQKPTAGIIFFSLLRLTMIAFILTVLIIYKLINIFGVLIGFTIVFIVILKEGLKVSKEL